MENKGLEQKPGVYKIYNTVTGKEYIGSSVNVYKRYYRHTQVLKERLRENIRILKDCEKFGIDSFEFEVIEYCERDNLKEREQYYFEKLKPEYNVWKSIYNAKGRDYTNEQLESFKKLKHPIQDKEAFKEKLRKAWVLRKTKPGFKEKHGDARRGIKHSDETKKKYSEMRKGKSKPESMKEKTRQRRLGTKLINGKFIKI